VSDRLAKHAAVLDEAILWLVAPPVAVARYVKALDPERPVHVTYAGGCPGVIDSSIDAVISPFELLAGIASRGIDINNQPRVFENIVPADRRRHASSPGGLPDQNFLWESSNYRVVQPSGADFSTRVAQLLLGDDRVLIDIAPTVGCLCRAAETDRVSEVQRSPTPVVTPGAVELSVTPPAVLIQRDELPPKVDDQAPAPASPPRLSYERPMVAQRPSSARPAYRRSVSWRRVSPRPGAVMARPSTALVTIADRLPILRHPAARWTITALIAAAVLMLGVWLGRRSGRIDASSNDRRAIQFPSAQPVRDRAL
jgi:hypothetical protein